MKKNDESRPHPDQLLLWTDAPQLDELGGDRPGGGDRRPGGIVGPGPDDCLWDIKAVAMFLGVPVATIYQWRVKREGPRATKMGKHLRFEPQVVRAWVTANRESA